MHTEAFQKKHAAILEQVRRCFEKHELVQTLGERHWVLKMPYADGTGYDSACAMEVIATIGSKLVVVGDYPPVIFAYGPPEPIRRVHWIGAQKTLNGYVAEKANMGTGEKAIYEWDEDLAKEELKELLLEEEIGEDEKAEIIEAATLFSDGRDAFLSQLNYEAAVSACHIGKTYAFRLYAAYAALEKLSHLLGESHTVATQLPGSPTGNVS